MTVDNLAEQIADELCMTADIPQACFVVDYAIRDVSVAFAYEGKPVSNDALDEDDDQAEDGE